MQALTITGIQTNLHWENKKANLQMLEEKILSISQPTEIVVLPEMFSTGFSMQPQKFAESMDGETVQWMRKISAQKKIILTGSLIIKEGASLPARRGDGGAYFNRLIWMLPNGQCGTYDKRHLFAYGDEDQHYTRGTKRLIASVKGWRINLLVCYDLRFPVWSRQSPAPLDETETSEIILSDRFEYDVLICVANWPERRNIAWKTLLQARAIENQCYVVGVNRVGNDGNKIYHAGDSMVIDPLGEIVYHKKDEEDIFTVTLQGSHLEKTREKFPFWKDADTFNIEN
jgi:predicted amidohydrolase